MLCPNDQIAEPDARTAVVKIGAFWLQPGPKLAALCRYLIHRARRGTMMVVIHDGDANLAGLQLSPGLFLDERERLPTTSEDMLIAALVRCNVINRLVVTQLEACGLLAMGFSGLNPALLHTGFGGRENPGQLGGPPKVCGGLLAGMLVAGMTPVLAPICRGPNGAPILVDPDTVALSVAATLVVDDLVLLDDDPGVRVGGAVAGHLSPAEAQRLLYSTALQVGAIHRLRAAVAAVDAGVDRVRIGDLESMQGATSTVVSW